MTQRRSSSSQPFQENSQQREDRSRSRTPLHTTVPTSEKPSKLRSTHSGFLGSTSYSAVFTEGESHITVQREPETRLENTNPAGYPDLFALESSDVKEGAQLLALMSEVPRYQRAIDQWYKVESLGQVIPCLQQCIEWAAKANLERVAGDDTNLLKLSRNVFLRTEASLDLKDVVDLSKMSTQFKSDFLCWEVIGLTLTVAGFGAICADEVPLDVYDRALDWKKVAKRFLSAGDQCILFCQEFGHLNDLSAWQILLNHILHTQVDGDADHMSWRTLGDVVATVYALGFHQEFKGTPGLPFFLAESRRKVFWFAYMSDKNFATFFGRPPMVTGKFCSANLPSDLDDAQPWLEEDSLKLALERLDDQGWNRNGPVVRMSWLRVSIIASSIREEILELSLGASSDNLKERAQEVTDRVELTYEKLPFKLRDRSNIWALDRSTAENFFHLTTHLERIYHHFLIQRTLVKRLRLAPTDLMSVARSLLSSMLVLLGNRHELRALAKDMPWLVSIHHILITAPADNFKIALYALPPAGVLALELLQHFRSPSKTNPEFPRSEIVQNLSILISSIDCIVRPKSGNYTICNQAKKMLQAVLDTVLSPDRHDVQIGSRRQLHSEDSGQPADADLNSDLWFYNDIDINFWMNLEDHPLLAWPDLGGDA